MTQRGEKLGGFLIQEELGRGGMGVVWRAEDSKLGREVALHNGLPVALDDGRHYLFNKNRTLVLLDAESGVEKPLLEPLPGSQYIGGRLGPGERSIYFVRLSRIPHTPSAAAADLLASTTFLAAAPPATCLKHDSASPWSKRRADKHLRTLATKACEKCGLARISHTLPATAADLLASTTFLPAVPPATCLKHDSAPPWSKRRADKHLRSLSTKVCEKCGLEEEADLWVARKVRPEESR